MKIVFVSNYFNHHQKPFCEEMYKIIGENFSFVSTSVMREERKSLGYIQGDYPPYVHLAYVDDQRRNSAIKLINDADAVIIGSAPNNMIKERIKAKKLIFRYSERPFKRKISLARKVYHAVRFHANDFGSKKIYMLCSSAYASEDYASIGMYKNRMYKWGYFPETKQLNLDMLFLNKKKNTILWCGRFLDWKHPDDAIQVARKLKERGYDFHLNMIGIGSMEEYLKQLVDDYKLDDVVHFLGAMPPDQVRIYMEESGIYLFTSDRQEGWGAVLNEAMNSGCAVVASDATGSAPFLIDDGENGMIYQSENVDMLFEKVKYLLDQQEKQEEYGRAAYQTIADEWNANIAAKRLMDLIKYVLGIGEDSILYEYGPCAKVD